MTPQEILEKLLKREDLTEKEVQIFLDAIVAGEASASQIAAFLTALRIKGESVQEIAGLIEGMRKHMISVKTHGIAVDTCGTGGDGLGTFNISTAAAFVVAGAGVKVAKHGNRAASSKCGSADVLEALGVHITLTSEQAEDVLEKTGMVFLFAPLFHPAMKHIAPIRKELGFRTVFNFLGPFLNPANVKRQVIGVPNYALAQKLAQVGANLNYEQLLIVTSQDGMDEVSLSAKTYLFEVRGNKVKKKVISPEDFGIERAEKDAIMGDNAVVNARMIEEMLAGKKGAVRDVVVLNSACALYISGKVKTIALGIKAAQQSIDSGKAKKVLETLQKETKQYA